MTYKRCDLCHTFGCRHVRLSNSMTSVHTSTPSVFAVGEPIQDILHDKDHEVDNKPVRIAVPPPPAILSEMTQPISALDAIQGGFAPCNLCQSKVRVQYLDRHMLLHTQEHKSRTDAITSTAIIQVKDEPVVHHPSPPPKDNPLELVKLQGKEHYQFRKIEDTFAAGSVSQSGRYSDLTIVFWLGEKTSYYSNAWAGGTGSSYKETERFVVHIVYDSKEHYYTVSCKLMKRSSYGTYDNEEGCPEMIVEQEELGRAIKGALLFFRISPNQAYRQFRKLFRDQELTIDRVESSFASLAQTENCDVLEERLKKSADSYNYSSGHYQYQHKQHDFHE